MDFWFWGGVGAVLMIVEIMAPGYYLAFPAAGGLLTGLVVLLGFHRIDAQLFLFALATGGGFWAFSQQYHRLMGRERPAEVNLPDRLIGAAGTVEDAIVSGKGKIRLGDSVWLARGPALPKGRPVTVTGVEGTVLVVAAQE